MKTYTALLSISFVMSVLGCGDPEEHAKKPVSSGSSSSGSGGMAHGGAGPGGNGGNTTSGTAGSGGAGGNTMSSGMGGSVSSSSGMGGAGGSGIGPCGPDPCGPGFYCDTPGCGNQGACVEKLNPWFQPKDKNPVCGCDHVTYWNANLAAAYGASVMAPGPCPVDTALKCSTVQPCPSQLRCNRKAPDMGTCPSATEGECWGIPPSCDPNGLKAYACSNQSCQVECNLIQSQNPWYDGACP